ncbi:MAG: hypothetical protein CSA09_01740 [Candidatus Contendobacter odensis]|uniref:FHA domain-containing protein n=1 Tax=Candidatus Contendibacter odensensis TaxID=1400860 RepID=A0A2G6PH61_9GAMM|nr:MAG: hypothetical protein CSA09_01740 [Candidatus Contendobacter odensis]
MVVFRLCVAGIQLSCQDSPQARTAFMWSRSWVSSYHARIHRLPGGMFRICDLGSANGTWVNGQQVRNQTDRESGCCHLQQALWSIL